MKRRHTSEDENEREWRTVELDPKLARRMGMPMKLPIPEEHFQSLADEGLNGEKLRGWIKEFLTETPMGQDGNWRRRNSDLVSSLEAYVDNAPLLDKAQKLFAEGSFDKALKVLKRITLMAPEDHAAKLNYAMALANQGQNDKAMKQLKQIRDTFTGDPDYHVAVANLKVAKNDQDGAIEELLDGLEQRPDHRPSLEALAKLGVLAKIYEDPKDAASLVFVRADSVIDYLRERWDSEERDIDFYLEQIAYHEKERRYHVALAAAERVNQASEEVVERARIGQISALRLLDRLDDALAAAAEFVAQAPRAASAHVELSACLAKAGKKDEAKAALDQALELDPGDQLALLMRYWPQDRDNIMQVSECLPALEKHAETHAGSAGAWRSLARAKLVCHLNDEALELFAKAVSLDPENDDLRGEWWSELAVQREFQQILDDAAKLGDMSKRHWQLRWNEAEANRGLNKMMEARACYMGINHDETLHVDIRKRAKRAVEELGTGL